tara:strand:+ start:4229 stop:7279 length:3051 start_codon:yes stop_codon:yes gene_type:complete
MSVQLILYPQYYDGMYNYSSYSANPQFLVNGHFPPASLPSVGSSFTYGTTAANPLLDALINNPPSVPNTWYSFTTTGSPWVNIAVPQAVSGNCYFSGAYVGANPFHTGIYQKITGLTVGAVYKIMIDITPYTSLGTLMIQVRQSNLGFMSQDSYSINASLTDIEIDFTATGVDHIILVDWNGGVGAGYSLTIDSMKVNAAGSNPLGVYNDLQDGQVICDLYENEDIPLTLSVDDFKNVAEKVQSYSKAFKLPATKRNNQIFDNIFEVTRSDTGLNFNPYVRTQCVLKQDGFILFEGYLRLIDIQDKKGEISYNVNLYSEVVALKDILEDATFTQLGFEELKHTYNITQIKNSWAGAGITYLNSNTSGIRDAATVRYPFVDWTHKYTFDGSNNPVLPNLESSFRPFINIKYLVDRIFTQTDFPFTYTSAFFETADFENLYMDFNWGNDSNPNVVSLGLTGLNGATVNSASSFTNVDYTNSSVFPVEFGWDDSADKFIIPAGQTNTSVYFLYDIKTWALLDGTLDFQWLYTPSGGTAVAMNPSTQTLNGRAYITFLDDGLWGIGAVDTVTVHYGGYYSSAPTLTVQVQSPGGTGADAVLTANGSFPGTITSVTIDDGGQNYHDFSDRILINGEAQGDAINTYSGSFTQLMNTGDTMSLQWKTNVTAAAQFNNLPSYIDVGGMQGLGDEVPVSVSSTMSIVGEITNGVFTSLRGDLEQWQFLKGLMTMFNLVSIPDPDNPTNIIIEPYADVFINDTSSGVTTNLTLASRGIAHDWTEKVDLSEMKLTPLTDLKKKTIFKFVDDNDDYPFNNYKIQVNGHLYGSQVFDATDFTLLSGEEEIVAEPFAATVPKPLMTQYPDLIVPAIYALDDDGLTEGFENAPRILYNNGVKSITSCTYEIPDQNNVSGIAAEDEILQFTHLSTIPSSSATTTDFNFGGCPYLGLGATAVNNLFTTYWSPYYYQLYNADTRTMTIKVNLSPSDINTFKFYDTVMIKNRQFRVNKIDYKPNDLATVEFILIP